MSFENTIGIIREMVREEMQKYSCEMDAINKQLVDHEKLLNELHEHYKINTGRHQRIREQPDVLNRLEEDIHRIQDMVLGCAKN